MRKGLRYSASEGMLANVALLEAFLKPKHEGKDKMNNRLNDVIISGSNIELTGALKQTVREKVDKLFAHENRIIRIRVELDQDKSNPEQQCSVRGHIEIRGRDLVATVRSEDYYKSLDELVNKLDRMLRRRARLSRVKRKRTQKVEIPAALPKVA